VAERFVVPLKLGNAGGGKGLSSRQTQDVGKDLRDWATYKLHNGFGNRRWRRAREQTGWHGEVERDPSTKCGSIVLHKFGNRTRRPVQ
jgi:hypothetical protein